MAIAQLQIRLRPSSDRQKYNVFPFCIAKQTPVGHWHSPNGPVQDVGSPLPVCPCFDRPQCPEITLLRHLNHSRAGGGEQTWHLRKQSQIATLPVLTCASCIAFSSFSLQRSRSSGPLPPMLPVAARAALKSFGVSAFGGMISGSPGPPFSSLGLLLFFSIFLQHGNGQVMSVRAHVLLAGFYNAEKPSVRRTRLFLCLREDRITNLSNAGNQNESFHRILNEGTLATLVPQLHPVLEVRSRSFPSPATGSGCPLPRDSSSSPQREPPPAAGAQRLPQELSQGFTPGENSPEAAKPRLCCF